MTGSTKATSRFPRHGPIAFGERLLAGFFTVFIHSGLLRTFVALQVKVIKREIKLHVSDIRCESGRTLFSPCTALHYCPCGL